MIRLTALPFCFAFALCLGGQPASAPMTNQRVVELVQAGVQPDELARLIANAPDVSFDLTPTAEDQMLKAGVTEDEIKQMAARVINGPALAVRPAASGQLATTQTVRRKHGARYWVIIGAAAAGAGYLTYWAATRSSGNGGGCCQNPFP